MIGLLKSQIRRTAFWGLDFVKGGKFKKHMDELHLYYYHPEDNIGGFRKKIDNLLNHAVETTPFYRSMAGFKDFTDFPVINKNLLKKEYNSFRSEPYKHLELPLAYTSGSTGTPFEYPVSNYKQERRHAEVLFYNQLAGYRLGMPFAQVRTEEFDKFDLWKVNTKVIDPKIMNDEWLEKQFDLMRSGNIQFLIGWPSVIAPIIAYCKKKGLNHAHCSLKGVICTAEPVSRNLKKSFEDFFQVRVYNRYATEELGIVAHDCKNCDALHVNVASHALELLSLDSDEPVAPGEPGRVVITDLNSHVMPLIRYDIGDIAVMEDDYFDYPFVSKIKEIVGRKNDMVYSPNGDVINWATIQEIIEDASGSLRNIIQYQFVQETLSDYILYIVKGDSFNQEAYMKENIYKTLGQDINFKIEYVNKIKELPSGKCPAIVNKTRL